MPPCRLCGEDRKLVKAHIIPKAFYEPGEGTMMLLTDREDTPPQRRPEGDYDGEILCGECEGIFMEWDDYAFKLLIERAGERERRQAAGMHYEVIEAYDYHKLKLFFMSVLLRADLSQRPIWQHVDLGKRKLTLRKYINRRRAPAPDRFPVYVTKMSTAETYPMYMPPQKEFSDGAVFYRFSMGRFDFRIRGDSGGPLAGFRKANLNPGKPLFIVEIPMAGSADAAVIRRIMANSRNARVGDRHTKTNSRASSQ